MTDAAGHVRFSGRSSPMRRAAGIEGQPYFARASRRACLGHRRSPAPHRDGPRGPVGGRRRPPHRVRPTAGSPAPSIAARPRRAPGHDARRGRRRQQRRGEPARRGALRSSPAIRRCEAHGEAERSPEALRELVDQGEISGTFHARSSVDGVERTFSYRKVAGYPLHITVGRATAEYLGHWRRDMGVVALLAGVLFAVAIGATRDGRPRLAAPAPGGAAARDAGAHGRAHRARQPAPVLRGGRGGACAHAGATTRPCRS